MLFVFSDSGRNWFSKHALLGGLIWALTTSAWLLPSIVYGAEIRGRISQANGQPATNQPIKIGSREIGRTDATGVYSLDLPPGRHVFNIMGQNVEVSVSPYGNRQDIQLK